MTKYVWSRGNFVFSYYFMIFVCRLLSFPEVSKRLKKKWIIIKTCAEIMWRHSKLSPLFDVCVVTKYIWNYRYNLRVISQNARVIGDWPSANGNERGHDLPFTNKLRNYRNCVFSSANVMFWRSTVIIIWCMGGLLMAEKFRKQFLICPSPTPIKQTLELISLIDYLIFPCVSLLIPPRLIVTRIHVLISSITKKVNFKNK